MRSVRALDSFIGSTLDGRYRVIEKIGEGGMGAVYLAEHVMIEKKVAIKVLSGDLQRRSDLVSRFQQEAKAASKIGHENIIDITDFGETPSGSVYFVMEYLAGRDLAKELRGRRELPIGRIVRIVGQVCRALAAAHAKGIFHRDLKPDNVFLVEREGRADFVKVLDFGLAKISALDAGNKLTRSGTVFGTAEYMSPEQARGETADHRTDVYALGCILYELVTGDVPFRAGSFMAVLRKQIEDAPEPPSRRAPRGRIAPPLEAVVMKALAKNREERFQTMKALALALCAATGEDAKVVWGTEEVADPALPAPSHPASRRRGLAIAGAAVALLAICAGAWRMRAPPPVAAPPPPVAAPPPPVAAPPPLAATPAPSRISIVSTPAGADVMAGPERLGATPLELAYASETPAFDVTVGKKGFLAHKLRVVPDRDREYVLQLLAAPRPSKPPKRRAPPPPPSRPPIKVPRELKGLED